MKISVCIPTIFKQDIDKKIWIKECISSLYSQCPYEILIWKDIEYSASKIRNKLAQRASWDFIWFLDDDVVPNDWVLKKAIEYITDFNLDVLQWVYYWWQNTNKDWLWVSWNLFIKRSIILENPFDEDIDKSWHEDLLLLWDLLEKKYNIAISEQIRWLHIWNPWSIFTLEKDKYAFDKYPKRWSYLKTDLVSYFPWEVLVL